MIKLALKELCLDNEIGKYGIPASAEEFDAKKVRYLRITDIDDFGNLLNNDKKSVSANDLDKYLLKEGDIVFARTGNSTGRTYYHEAKNGDLAFAGFLIKYGLDSKKINPKYLKYYTLSSEYKQWVKNLSVGSTRGNINAFTFANCPISVPERKQQNLLVNVLSALDDKIELNNQINAELEAMAKTLYDYWFVQFDFPDAEGKPYKSSGGEMVYSEVLKREIPKGWVVKKLSEIANITMGQSPSGESLNEADEGMIFFQGSTDFGWRYPENRVFTTMPTRLAKENDVLLSVRAPIGALNIAMHDCCIGRGVAALHSKNGFNSYLTYLMNHFKKKFEYLNSVGTTFGSLTKDDLYGLENVYPEESVLRSFEIKVSVIDMKIKNNTKQNQQLAQLRDWLLPMLMNGQVTVGEAEEMVEGLGMVAEERIDYKKQ